MGAASRLRVVLFLAGVFVALTTAPALADPATPTNYRSQVTAIDPPGSLVAKIIGGDAFVHVVANPGREVIVLGYEGEPYIRFAPDGVVTVNRRSPAASLNDDRYAQIALAADANADAEPRWEPVASGGEYSWHDHRTHWMSRTPPSAVTDSDGSQPVTIFQWSLPLVVDGSAGSIDGTLNWVPSSSPAVWVLVVVGFTAVGVLVLRNHQNRISAAVTITAALALIVAIGAFLAQPPAVRVSGIDIIGPAVAIVIGGYALFLQRTRASAAPRIAAVAAAALIAWAVLRIDVLTHPLLPTLIAPTVDRFLTSVVLGASLGVLGAVILSPAAAAPGASRATTV
jgi:hypothetical protein